LNGRVQGNRRNRGVNGRFTLRMQKKLVVLFLFVLSAFVGLGLRLVSINKDDGARYEKQVLSQQTYDSTTIPFRRGDILDSKGTKLAASEKVYNVILDAKVMRDRDGKYIEPTIEAVQKELGLDTGIIRSRLESHPDSSYYVLAKQMTYEEIRGFKELQEDEEAGANIKGIWFEEEYRRIYPNGRLACDLIGFTRSDNNGLYGLEQYYNNVLSGTAGREYGYLNDDAALERTTIAAVDGNSIVTTIDVNIQSIVEKYLRKFNEEYKDNFVERNGSNNTACIIMEVNTGNILAMASYPDFDLNDRMNPEDLYGMPMVNDVGNVVQGEYLTPETFNALDSDLKMQQFNALWRNFCINDTYEPGSVAKPFTVAAALDSGKITGDEYFNCNGVREIGGYPIKCHNKWGDGEVSVAQAVEISCNVAMMDIAAMTGRETYIDYQHIFNFGLKTNIDLWGESRTSNFVYDINSIGPTELATNSFGQGYNVTMIQMITGFCSLINGGNYYEPHVVSKIISPSGATVQNIEPRLLKQTISTSVSEKIKEYCNLVVSGENGTGKTARPAGYLIGGKTGTAETLPRKNNEYVVSFMGYAPADDPQIAIYVVVDRPNVQYQADAKFATGIVRNILTEVLPYMGIFMTEELTDKERKELEDLQQEIMSPVAPEEEGQEGAEGEEGGSRGEGTGANGEEGSNGTPGNGEEGSNGTPGSGEEGNNGTSGSGEGDGEEGEKAVRSTIWKSFPIDPESGYAKDPETGTLVDPETGHVVAGGDDSTPAGLGSAGGNRTDSEEDNSPF
jgi:stage V sporulation protein D (sporulation-specific penicillin-binding protein)